MWCHLQNVLLVIHANRALIFSQHVSSVFAVCRHWESGCLITVFFFYYQIPALPLHVICHSTYFSLSWSTPRYKRSVLYQALIHTDSQVCFTRTMELQILLFFLSCDECYKFLCRDLWPICAGNHQSVDWLDSLESLIYILQKYIFLACSFALQSSAALHCIVAEPAS